MLIHNTNQHKSNTKSTQNQHKSTQIITNHHESTQIYTNQHESTQINTNQHKSTQINTNQHKSTQINTNQHKINNILCCCDVFEHFINKFEYVIKRRQMRLWQNRLNKSYTLFWSTSSKFNTLIINTCWDDWNG